MITSPLTLKTVFTLGPIRVTEPVVVTWGVMALLTLGSLLVTSRLKMRPGRGQAALELVVSAIEGQIRDTMGVSPRPYLPLIGTLFLFILAANWSSLIPGVEPPTAHLETDVALALIVFVALVWSGVRAHGIRGDVMVGVRTDEPELRFAVGSKLDTDPAAVGPLTVAATRWHSGELIVRFAGVRDRTAAEGLRGTWLTVDSSALEPLPDPDEFRDHDLIGLAVRTAGGAEVGEVADILHYGQDLLVVRSAAGSEVLVPFVREIVPDVDLSAGTLVIDPPPGLLDPDEAV